MVTNDADEENCNNWLLIWLEAAVVVPSTSDDTDKPAKVDWLDYTADGSEDDTKEAASTSIKRPTMDNDPSKVHSNEFYP